MNTYIDCFKLSNKIPDTPVIVSKLQATQKTLLSKNRNLKIMLVLSGITLVSYAIYTGLKKEKETQKKRLEAPLF